MKKQIEEESQENLNAEMLAAISKLTRAGFLLMIVLILLLWQNYSRLFGSKNDGMQVVQTALPILSPTAQKGKDLFKNNCASCHNRDMQSNLTGPALGGVQERWAAYPRTDLYQWIRNSQALIDAGHPRAQELWNKWKPVIMTPSSSLKDEDIDAILTYVEEQYAAR
ncbi:cytochrome c [Haliscomenobacter sp.]|uniref:c-type cytochrome n=1 Tax=Haliscomenobacter sp. TaxID=2717303 RepID=UPI0035940AF8